MLKQLSTLLPLLLITFFLIPDLSAQTLEGVDIRNLRADELTDQQVRQLDNRLQDEGLSLAEFERLAIQRGARATEVRRLRQRLQEQRMQRGERVQPGDRMQLMDDDLRDRERFREFDFEMEDQFVPFELDTIVTDSLQIFGMQLFGRVSRTFEPSFNIPTPRNYTLGAGDQVVIDIWGAAETFYRLPISSEGQVQIDNLGPIYLNGLTIEEAESRLLNQLSNIYSGLNPDNQSEGNTFAQVSLGNVRSINVTVMGEVKQPASYTVSSLATVFNALYAAGGPTRNGTFRAVEVIRGRDVVATLDIYDFLVHGDQTDNIRLRDEDIIKVDPYQNRVHVWGETKRKGFFELKDGETLGDLMEYVSGFTEEAYRERLVLRRNTPTQRSVSDVVYPEGSDLEMLNGDRLRVGKILERYENRVTIEGAVFRPGEYELTSEMTLYDLIQKADGPKEDAFMSRGIIYRLKDDLSMETQSFDLRNVIQNPEEYDIALRRDDQVRVSSIFDMREEYTISVQGAVNDSGEFEFAESMSVEDAIYIAGGFRDEAAEYRVEVARRVTGDRDEFRMDRIAEVFRFSVDQNLQFSTGDLDFNLMPFDQVYVRTKPNYQEQQTVRIRGEVQYPGTYVLDSRNARLTDLIEMAGGMSDYAFPEGASLQRRIEEDVLEEVEVLDTLMIQRREMMEEQMEEEDRRHDIFDENGYTTTQVGIRLEQAMNRPGSMQDLILEPGDVINVPKELQTVRVEGEVLHPVSIRFDDGRSFQSYINAAGGTTDEAQRRRAYIVYANGEVDRTRRILFFRSNPDVRPGATIFIPPKPERRELTPQERVGLASSIASTAILIVTLVDRLSD